jgi:hypothetical protein
MRRSRHSPANQSRGLKRQARPSEQVLLAAAEIGRPAAAEPTGVYEIPMSYRANLSRFPMCKGAMAGGAVASPIHPSSTMARELRSPDSTELLVREWLLLLLRFAITRQPSDRSAVCAMAEQLDSPGQQVRPSAFRFFRRTSEEVCRAIVAGDGENESIIRRYIARIDDSRLQRAFLAAVGLPTIPRHVRRSATNGRQRSQDLWKGLPSIDPAMRLPEVAEPSGMKRPARYRDRPE